MLPAQRQQSILEYIAIHGASTLAELCELFGVSSMTIHRDLKTLEEQGYIKRTHGGAVYGNANHSEPLFVAKQNLNRVAKHRIAQYAASKFVQNGDIIILEAGTTVAAMGQYLLNYTNLTIVTNGLHTANELTQLIPHNNVICTGGNLREISYTFVGPLTERFFQEFHASKVFLSATGLTSEHGYTDPNIVEVSVKQAMIKASDHTYMLMDSSKWGLRSMATVLGIDTPHTLITDDSIPEAALKQLTQHKVDAHVVASQG